jgi:hypothetical protein
MIRRSDIEQALLDEEAVLEQVARLLEGGSELASWPEELRTALALALTDAAMSRTESWKAVVLRRHLFGPADRIPDEITLQGEPSSRDRRRAERLRADAPARVRYRAGVHLLRPPRGVSGGAV